MFDTGIGEADPAAAAQQTPHPVEVNVPAVPELSLVELTQVWTLGVGSDRSLGRPKEWNGEPSGFDDFAFKFSNWLSGLPGDAERFLEESVTMAQPIPGFTFTGSDSLTTIMQRCPCLVVIRSASCLRAHTRNVVTTLTWRHQDTELRTLVINNDFISVSLLKSVNIFQFGFIAICFFATSFEKS